jgi:hypothetical protein
MDSFERVHDLGPLQNGIQGMGVRKIEIYQSPPADPFNDSFFQNLSESISVHPLLFGDLFLPEFTGASEWDTRYGSAQNRNLPVAARMSHLLAIPGSQEATLPEPISWT